MKKDQKSFPGRRHSMNKDLGVGNIVTFTGLLDCKVQSRVTGKILGGPNYRSAKEGKMT